VTLDWLLESQGKKKKAAEKKYLVDSKDDQKDSTAQDAVAPATDSDKKRPASPAVNGVQPPSKKKREEKPAEKKIHVPVDEGCKDGGKLFQIPRDSKHLWLINIAAYDVLIDEDGVIWVNSPRYFYRLSLAN
jgi:poly [ADP-ribose] polymerase